MTKVMSQIKNVWFFYSIPPPPLQVCINREQAQVQEHVPEDRPPRGHPGDLNVHRLRQLRLGLLPGGLRQADGSLAASGHSLMIKQCIVCVTYVSHLPPLNSVTPCQCQIHPRPLLLVLTMKSNERIVASSASSSRAARKSLSLSVFPTMAKRRAGVTVKKTVFFFRTETGKEECVQCGERVTTAGGTCCRSKREREKGRRNRSQNSNEASATGKNGTFEKKKREPEKEFYFGILTVVVAS